ncbi:MAG TPA: ATP-binding protein [Mycobacteriales bacterium]|nr:ATP-binding protein [Mycobacteriales bacterium]
MSSSFAGPLPHLAGEPPVRGAIHLPHEPLSAGVARAHVRELLAHWDDDVRVQDALLLTTELVSNAIIHGWPSLRVRAWLLSDHLLRVEVYDASPGMPRLRAAWAGGGRGLTILDETADAWGVEPEPSGGKTVWFELLA